MRVNLRRCLERTQTLDQMEAALVQAGTDGRQRLARHELDTARYALNLARTEIVPAPGGDVDVSGPLESFHARVVESIGPLALRRGGVEVPELRAALPALQHLTARTRAQLLIQHADAFGAEHLDREVGHKALVVVAGGGGGAGYVYAGAFKLLDDLGAVPSLIVGTSMGAIMGLFRARRRQLDVPEMLSVAERMRFGEVFSGPNRRSRFGLPATLRLHLRRALGWFFRDEASDRVVRLNELEIPLRVIVAGVGPGGLTHDLGYYEHLMDEMGQRRGLMPRAVRGGTRRVVEVFRELARKGGELKEIALGADELTADFDALDAVGFSAAVPGLIHYDIWRDDPHMEALLDRLFQRHGVVRLVDGGVVNNVPARTARYFVERGDIRTRNAFILALDSFAPQLGRNLVTLPVQQLVRPQVAANVCYAQQVMTFRQVLSPLELVPSAAKIQQALRNGYKECAAERHFLREMMRPIPPPE